MVSFSEGFRIELEKQGLTLNALSKITGFDRAVLSRWRSGKRDPRTRDAQKVADGLGITLGQLLQENRKEV